MKYLVYGFAVSGILLSACSDNLSSSGAESRQKSDLVSIQKQLEGDSLLPYFEFDSQGKKTQFDFSSSEVVFAKRSASRSNLVLDSMEQFYELEEEISLRLASDEDYRRSIPRPLDYVCRTAHLALNKEYETIKLKSGETILSDQMLFKNCEYIGLSCSGDCDESGTTDPYIEQKKKAPTNLNKIQETYASSETVEIYPYRMMASSFISGTAYIYSSAGSETYFKKRERVWRGLDGMVWRWVDFDPDRNGIRSNCFSNCILDQSVNNYGGYVDQSLTCSSNMVTDLDEGTFSDTEDITIRCSLSMVINKIGVKYDNGTATPQAGGFKLVREYGGGVIGSHYVKHGENVFKAKTSIGLSADMRAAVLRQYSITYR